MKTNKISRMLGVGLTVALLTGMLVAVAPVSAGTLSLSTETDLEALKTSTTQGSASLKLAPFVAAGTDGLNIVSMAVKGKVIYAATGAAGTTPTTVNPLYKSVDTGATWSTLASTTDFPNTAGVVKAVNLVAVAADDDKVVVIVAADNTVYYTVNGGSSWSNLGIPFAGVLTIDVSAPVTGTRYVVAGGAVGVTAAFATMKLDIGQVWTSQTAVANFVAGTGVYAVKISPKFATDRIVTVLSQTAATARFQVFRLQDGGEAWNNGITVFGTDWTGGITITGNALTPTISGALSAAAIALPASYLGTNSGDRIAFISFATGTAAEGGVWRLSDAFAKEFKTWSEGQEGGIGSIAYHASGKLLAGDWDSSQVFRSIAPMASDPKFERLNAEKQPGGTGMVYVAYADATPVAGTRGNESAFATSADDGNSFNDLSLIDTQMGTMDDVAVSADGKTIYLTTRDALNDASVWLKEGTLWIRVLSLQAASINKALSGFLVRLAPADAKVVYLSAKSNVGHTADQNRTMWVSTNSAKASLTNILAYRNTIVQDFAVLNATTVYAMDTTGVAKSTDSGSSWAEKKSLDGLTTGHMITLAPGKAGDVLVGTTSGDVAFSKDGGATFYKTTNAATGTTQVIADAGYEKNNIIYAIGTSIKRGTAISTTQTWGTRGPTDLALTGGVANADSFAYVGAASVGTVIYALANSTNTTNSRLYRALNLTTAATSDLALWSYMAVARNSTATPQAMKSSTPTKLWVVSGNRLYSAADPIATAAPAMTGPAAGASVSVNPETGKVYNITFTFNRLAGATGLTDAELQIATDAAFSAIVTTIAKAGIDTDTISIVVNADAIGLNPGATYYWRVRMIASKTAGATNQLTTPWSAARSFSTLGITRFEVMSPAQGAEGVSLNPTFTWATYAGAIGYELNVSKDPTFETITWIGRRKMSDTFYKTEVALDYSTVYYWRLRAETGKAAKEGALAPGSDWMKGIFTTMSKPAEAAGPTVITVPAAAPPAQIIQVPVPQPTPIPSYLLWTIIGIGAVLIIALIVLIARTRRVA